MFLPQVAGAIVAGLVVGALSDRIPTRYLLEIVDGVLADERVQLFFREDRYAIRVQGSGERCGILAILYVRYLRRSESDHMAIRVVAVTAVEDMEVPSCRTHDDYLAAHTPPFYCSWCPF